MDLNEILDRAMPKASAPPEEDARSSAQDPDGPEHVSRETDQAERPAPSPASEKARRRSSVYIYLVVLFGAAFLMLLLAYFVQQRNNANAMDDLRSTTTASRQELLEKIATLEEEKKGLQAIVEAMWNDLEQERQENEALQETSDGYWNDLMRMTIWYDNAHILDCLETFDRSGDFLMAGVAVSSIDGKFNQNSPYYDGDRSFLSPAQEKRYMELREELFDESGFMVLTRSVSEESLELPAIAEGTFEPEVLEAAQRLWAVIRNYAIAPDLAAVQLADLSDSLSQIDSSVFKASTIDLLEEIEADLIAQGRLLVEGDGTLTAVDPPENSVENDSGT